MHYSIHIQQVLTSVVMDILCTFWTYDGLLSFYLNVHMSVPFGLIESQLALVLLVT